MALPHSTDLDVRLVQRQVLCLLQRRQQLSGTLQLNMEQLVVPLRTCHPRERFRRSVAAVAATLMKPPGS